MALVKVLTKDDLAVFQDLLEESNKNLEKLLIECARLMNCGGMAAKMLVPEVVKLVTAVDQARVTNAAQMLLWEQLQPLNEADRLTLIANFMAISLAEKRARRAAEEEQQSSNSQ